MTGIDGFGLGLRAPFVDDLLARPDRAGLDFVEITPENWMFFGGRRRRQLDAIGERFPIVPHGVSLDVGGLSPLDAPFTSGLRALVARYRAPFVSDHLCYSTVAGRPTHDLLPLPFTHEAIENVGARAKEASRRFEARLVLENATFYSTMPGAELDEAAFLAGACEAGGCELLLDVNNVYVNARNHGFDARAFIDRLPLDRVRYLHVAGHTDKGDVIIDTHVGPIVDEVWALYRHVLARAGRLVPTVVEWDQEIPALDVVLAEVARARSEAHGALGDAALAIAGEGAQAKGSAR